MKRIKDIFKGIIICIAIIHIFFSGNVLSDPLVIFSILIVLYSLMRTTSADSERIQSVLSIKSSVLNVGFGFAFIFLIAVIFFLLR